MNTYTGMPQPIFYVHLQVIAHPVRFFHTSILGHYQVKVNEALASCLSSTQFVETY